MQSQHTEKIFFKYILQNPDYLSHVNDRFFDSEDYKLILPKVQEFFNRYKQSPSEYQLQQLLRVDQNLEKVTDERLKIIYSINVAEYDNTWLKETLEAWIEFKNLEMSIFDVVSYIKSSKVNQDNVKEMVNRVKDMIVQRNSIDFSFTEGVDFFDTDNHFEEAGTYFSSGYNYIDTVLGGGFYRKALFILAAPPKTGKSLWLANIAAEAVKAGTNVIYYTFELSEKKVLARIGANMLNIPIKDYWMAAQDKVGMKNKMAGIEMENMKTPGKLLIKEFPTSCASVNDLQSHCQKSEEKNGVEYPLIIIDYINIMANWKNPNSENTYLKIKQISEDLRAWGTSKNKCLVSATQTTRGSYNATDFNSGAIAESAGLMHTVDGMFGIIQDEIMLANREYYLKLLLNRNDGFKNSKKRFDVNYNYMQIREDLNSDIIEQQ